MANSKFRVGGHYTAFTYNGSVLIYAQMIAERGPQPVAGPLPIQPLDAAYPIEIALPAALEAGTLEVTFLEQWNAEVWAQLGSNFTTAADLLDVFKAQLAQGDHPKVPHLDHVPEALARKGPSRLIDQGTFDRLRAPQIGVKSIVLFSYILR